MNALSKLTAPLLVCTLSLALHAIPGHAQTTAGPALSLRPRWDSPEPDTYCYAPGSTVTILVKAAKPGGGTGNIHWQARDFSGRVLAQGQQALDAAGNAQIQLQATDPGIVYVTAAADANAASEAVTSFAVLSPEPAAGDAALPILYGISTHLQGLGARDAEREAALMKILGFRACRLDLPWTQVQPARGEWHWEVYDRVFPLLEKYGVTPAPVLAYTTRWASMGDQNATDARQWRYAPPVTADYVNFVREAARRYGRTTPYWEVWNEPDIASWQGTAGQYATLFEAASNAIHAEQPGALVMNGGFSETKRRPDFIPTWQKAVRVKPDIYAYHSHGNLGNMLRAGADAAGYMKSAGWNMPLWLNESGFSSSGRLTERDQAITLVKKMSAAPSLGFGAYFWYDLYNDGTDPNENEHNFGLIHHDFTPKASAVAAHTLLTALGGCRFVRRIPLPELPQAYALLFERPDHSGGTLVLWNEATSSVPLYWKTPAATRVSIMGETAHLAARDGLTVLAAAPEPVFLGFTGPAAAIEPAGPVLDFPASVTVAAGQSMRVPVTLRNPFPRDLSGQLAVTASGGWRVDPAELPGTVPAGASKTWNVRVTAPASTAGPESLRLEFTSPQLPESQIAQAQLSGAVVIPRRGAMPTLGEVAAWGQPVARLSAGNRISLFEATPMQELHFHGDEDLSAEIYLKRVPQGLNLAVRARDDVLAQNEAPGEEWRGDSIQWALALPTGEHYEWFAALTKDGPVATLGIAPAGVKTGRMELPLWIHREGNETLYETILPDVLPGQRRLTDRFGFTLLVNDNDGSGRKGWAEWTPGIGRSKDPTQFQSIVVGTP